MRHSIACVICLIWMDKLCWAVLSPAQHCSYKIAGNREYDRNWFLSWIFIISIVSTLTLLLSTFFWQTIKLHHIFHVLINEINWSAILLNSKLTFVNIFVLNEALINHSKFYCQLKTKGYSNFLAKWTPVPTQHSFWMK